MKKLLKYSAILISLSAVIVFTIVGVTEYQESKRLNADNQIESVEKAGDGYSITDTEFVYNHLGHVYYTNEKGSTGRLTFVYEEFEDYIRFPKDENDMEVVEKLRDRAEQEIRKLIPDEVANDNSSK